MARLSTCAFAGGIARATGLALAVALLGCVGEITGGAAYDAESRGAALRLLSTQELRNTIEALTGVSPQSFEQLPPDSLTYSYDRVVNSQTMTPAHLDAYLAIATEISETLIADKRLDDLVGACDDEILPPVTEDRSIEVNGNALALEPDWAVTDASDARHSRTLYAPDPIATYRAQFDSPGEYRITFAADFSGPVQLNVDLDGTSIDQRSGVYGNVEIENTIEIELPGSHNLEFRISTQPDYDNLDVTYRSIQIDGPVDKDAEAHAQARASCAQALIDDFAPRAFRQPLSADQHDRLTAIVASQTHSSAALRVLLQSIFMSPRFLYLVEVGDEAKGSKLTSWEMASRLSYSICEQPPDAELRAAAADDRLRSAPEIESQARRLFDKPCAEVTTLRFFEHWLWLNRLESLNKSPEAFPDYSDEVRLGMQAETRRFLREIIWNQEASLQTLMTAEYAWPDPRSAFLYGLEGVGQQVETPVPNRAGILTQPAVLAVTSLFESTSPVKRGVFVLKQLLCDEPPAPPAEIDLTPPLPDPNATTRERWSQHTASETCASCHSQIDPIGFAFEEFDAIGQYRSQENGFDIDAQGGVPSIGIPDGTFSGAKPLVQALASSPELSACVAKQWLRFSLGRVESEHHQASLDELAGAFEDRSLREALISIVTTDAFTRRNEGQP